MWHNHFKPILFSVGLWINQLRVASAIGYESTWTPAQAIVSVSDGAKELEKSDCGVGFHLTASYGAAAVSFPNGTVVSVANVTADEKYTDMLQRFSLASSQHLTPPYQNPGDAWEDEPRETLRKARRAIGLPASEDVGLLANMLSDLHKKVEDYLGKPIESATVAVPDLIAFYREDLQDAFEYVGLRYLALPVRYDLLYETSAAYAGYGFGLCSDYKDRAACKKEQQEMPSEVVMAVVYSRTALTVTLSVVKSAYYLYEPINRHLSNFSLGYDAQTRWGDNYWKEVSFNLEKIMVENPYYQRPHKVLLMGDRVDNATFLGTLKAALNAQTSTLPEIISKKPLYVAAEGAAELAKRAPYDPYKS